MKTRSSNRSKKALALAFSFGLVAAACGSDDDGGESDAPPATEAEAPAEETEEAPAEESEEAPAEESEEGEAAPAEEPAGEVEAPTGEPIRIGVQNPEGDPNGSFPEYSASIEAAANYINAELGGLGGRPVEIEVCKTVISPDDSQRCANELSASGVELAISTINFFGNHFGIYQGSGIPVVVSSAVTLGDFTSEGVYAIGAGGGCLGVHTGLVQVATDQIEELAGITVERVGVPWADTPPGVVCYNDLEAKPLDVINGTTPGESARAGERPDLSYIGVPIAPATPDVTPQATEVLAFDPDVIIFSGQGADCWNLVDALGRLGWSNDEIPLILSGSCTDFDAIRAAGDLVKGIYVTTTQNGVLTPPDGLEGQHLDNATTYQTKAPEYGMPEDLVFTGFGGNGFSTMMNIWEIANTIDGEVTGQAISDAFAATDGSLPAFGGSPLDCSGAPEPYTAVCTADISLNQWDGEKMVKVIESTSGLDLVAGTELRPG